MPRSAGVTADTIFKVLKNEEIFDEEQNLKKERDDVWKKLALRFGTAIKKHNLYNRVCQNRDNLQHRLRTHIFGNAAASKKKLAKNVIRIEDKYKVVHDILEMANTPEYNALFQQIRTFPFHIMYWLPEQVDLYKNISSQGHLGVILIEKVLQDVQIGEREQRVDLICILGCISNFNVPLYQTLTTESCKRAFVQKFFREILKTNKPPTRIYVDFRHELVTNISRVLNFCSFEISNLNHFLRLQNRHACVNATSTIIQFDILQVLEAINAWPEFEDNCLSKKFYINSVFYISTLLNLHSLEKAMTKIFILCQAKIGTATVKAIKNDLIAEIGSNDIFDVIGKTQNHTQKNSFESFQLGVEKTELNLYIEGIKARALASIESEPKGGSRNLNGYYSMPLCDKLTVLFEMFPAWTNLVLPCNPGALRTCKSEHVTEIKKFSPQGQKITDFLASHYNMIKIQCAEGRKLVKGHKGRILTENPRSGHKFLTYQENWMGKNPVQLETKTTDHTLVEIINETCSVNLATPISTPMDEQRFSDAQCQADPLPLEEEISLGLMDSLSFCYAKSQPDLSFLHTINYSPSQKMTATPTDYDTLFHPHSPCKPPLSEFDHASPSHKMVVHHSTPVSCNYTTNTSLLQMDDSSILEAQFRAPPFSPQSVGISPSSIVNRPVLTNIDPFEEKKHEEIEVEMPVEETSITPFPSGDHSYAQTKHSIEPRQIKLDSKNVQECPGRVLSKGIYVTQFPAAGLYYSQATKKRTQDTLIKSASNLQPKLVGKTKFVFKDSSALDSLAEIYSVAYKNYKSFRAYCDSDKCLGNEKCFLTNVTEYCTKQNIQKFYKARALMLYTFGLKQGDTIFIEGADFITRLLKEHPCLQIKVKCNHCDFVMNVIITAVDLGLENLVPFNAANMFQYLENYLKHKFYCNDCNQEAEMMPEFTNVMLIDVEKIQAEAFLNQIPRRGSLSGKTFLLAGIMGYTIDTTNNQVHYTAYTTSITGHWQMRDNMKKKITHLKALPQVHLSHIVYIICDNP